VNCRESDVRCIVTRDTRKGTVRNQHIDKLCRRLSGFKHGKAVERRQSSRCCFRITASGFVKHQGRDELLKPMSVMIPPVPSHLLVGRG